MIKTIVATYDLSQVELIGLARQALLTEERIAHPGIPVDVDVRVVATPFSGLPVSEIVRELVKEVARGDNRILMIKHIRALTNMSLRDSKAIVDAYVPHKAPFTDKY